MLKRVIGLCAAGFLFAAVAACANLSGIWTGQITDKNGDIQDLSFRFNFKDNKLSGKMYTDNESVPVENPVIQGNQITFSVTTELNGAVSKFTYTGQIDGDDLTLVRRKGGIAKINPAVDKPVPENKQNLPQTIKFKRLV